MNISVSCYHLPPKKPLEPRANSKKLLQGNYIHTWNICIISICNIAKGGEKKRIAIFDIPCQASGNKQTCAYTREHRLFHIYFCHCKKLPIMECIAKPVSRAIFSRNIYPTERRSSVWCREKKGIYTLLAAGLVLGQRETSRSGRFANTNTRVSAWTGALTCESRCIREKKQ